MPPAKALRPRALISISVTMFLGYHWGTDAKSGGNQDPHKQSEKVSPEKPLPQPKDGVRARQTGALQGLTSRSGKLENHFWRSSLRRTPSWQRSRDTVLR